ncbi:hypothetical protein ODU14_09230, partial [Streptococcus suis]|uniref:hypothetical protein n=1 Tax=Streptococcus suis TaxID=1307 RepID=UPI0037CE6F3D
SALKQPFFSKNSKKTNTKTMFVCNLKGPVDLFIRSGGPFYYEFENQGANKGLVNILICSLSLE